MKTSVRLVRKLFALSVVAAFSLLPIQARAQESASLSFTGPAKTTLGSGVTLRAILTAPVAVNVIQGIIHYDNRMVEVTRVTEGLSIIKYWQQQPNLNTGTGTVSFTGGLPSPGFQGANGSLVTLTLKAKAIGTTSIVFTPSSQILANDGNGTALPITTKSFLLQIDKTEAATPTPAPSAEAPKDITPPINLEMVVGHDSHLFEGAWFAVFQATDTDSGIDHYEVAETSTEATYPEDNEWSKANSPFRLTKQNENTKVFVKAVDKAGNQSVISHLHVIKPLEQTNTPIDWRLLVLLAAIMIIGLVLPIFVYHRKKQQATVQK